MLYCFLDTNIFLHFTTFDEIDWLSELKTKEVTLVIPMQVINELDKWKREPKHAKKAEAAVKKIKLYKDGKAVRKGVYLKIVDEPFTQWLRENGFDHENPDSRIIGSIKNFVDVNPDAQVVSVSDDINFQIRIEAKGLQYVELNEEYKLSIELSPEAEELKKIKREIELLKNAQPKMTVHFVKDGRDKVLELELHPKFLSNELSLEELTEKLNAEKQNLTYELPEGIPHDFLQPTPQKYDRDIELFLQNYEKYLKRLVNYKNHRSRIVELDFLIENEGSAPANDVDIFFFFPPSIRLLYENPVAPKKPEYPQKPQIFSLTIPIIDEFASLNRFPSVAQKDKPIRDINLIENSISTKEKQIKHGHWLFAPFFVELVLPKKFESYVIPIKYKITVANLPKAVDGQLLLRINLD